MTLRLHTLLLIALAAASAGTQALAATGQAKPAAPMASPASTAADSALADGVVKKIDKAGKRVTLAHGPLPSGMPAMTMAYRVKDVAWLDKMKEGQKIRFATDPADGGMTVLRFEPAK